MPKQSGLGANFYVAGFNLSNDTQSLSRIGGGISVLEVTGIDKSAYERIGGKRDGSIEWTAYYNTDVGQEHAALSGLPTTDQHLMYCTGTTLGNPAACLVSKELNYDGTRDAEGNYTFQIQALANGFGLEWGNLLTAGLRQDSTATSPATGVDFTTVSTAFGWQAYLQIVAFAGTSVTVTIQDSADNSTFANLTGGAFTAATAIGTQRLQGASNATVRRYLKVNTTGTFSNAVFAVVFVRNTTSVVF